MKLNILKTEKIIEINGKTVHIPKLGLRHHEILKVVRGHEESMKLLLNSIHKNLSQAERDLVTVHLLHFNGKLKETVEINGVTVSVLDSKIDQQLKFEYDGVLYRFKSPTSSEMNDTVDGMLSKCCVSVKQNGKELPVPDFLDMPACVLGWAHKIADTLSLDTPNGPIRGLYDIVEVFNVN